MENSELQAVGSVLTTKASEELQQKVLFELEVEDPEDKEKALASLQNENTTRND